MKKSKNKKKSAKLSNADKIKLVNLVENHPALYNKALPDAINKEDSWNRIGKRMGMSNLTQLKQTWTNIRNNFVKKWRMNGSKTEAKKPSNETWFLYEHLLFLQPFLEPVSQSLSIGLSDSEYEIESTDSTDEETESDDEAVVKDGDEQLIRPAKNRKRQLELDVTPSISKEDKENLNESFGAYLAKELNRLSPELQLRIKMDVQNSIYYNVDKANAKDTSTKETF